MDELENIESGKRKSWDVMDVPTEDDPEEVTKKDIEVTLEDVLFFLTGSRYLPTKGLKKGRSYSAKIHHEEFMLIPVALESCFH